MATQTLPKHGHRAPVTDGARPTRKAAALVVVLTLAVALILVAFGLPAARSKPHDIPVGIVGPQQVTAQVEGQLERNAPGGFAATTYPDAEALRNAIIRRDVYGGIAFGPQGPSLLLASGGSPLVAQLLTQIGAGISQSTGAPLRTEDLAPLPPQDPRGTGIAASALPLTLAGLLPAYALVLMFRREVWLRCATTVVFAGVAALTITVVLRYVFGSIEANFWGVAAGLYLGALAMGLSVLGLGSVFGRAGLALGAVIAMLLGNPLSGLTSAPEMLPRGWGAFGQFLPQGANGTLLRSTAYFGGTGANTSVVVLGCWVAAGLALVVVAALRQRRSPPA